MFTGIVQGTCKIANIIDSKNQRKICIKLEDFSSNLKQGASIAVNGVCLTVISIEKDFVEFDIVAESLSRSNLGFLKIGDYVNIERACRLGEEVGGHQISGHVDCLGSIHKIIKEQNIYNIVFECEIKWMKYLFTKGWITIDGISLTVVDIENNLFSVSLIPETINQTSLGKKKEGDFVNLEFDNIAKVIVDTLKRIMPEIKKNY
tara:strand:+ start:506 stop:1120 length:615 start_codon:yes stop_codon:yes gene_type:complete